MTDREEREEHIKRLEAALACEEKQSSGKCSKQTCDDNCALLYEQGNWGEWKETLRYAINSLKIDLKYDLLYEETSGQADKRTTKNDLAHNLCNSCTNIGCELKSIIAKTTCVFYMPPHLEPDNCGNYVVQEPTIKKDCNTCTHNNETDGRNCYECIKNMYNNYEPITKNYIINDLDDFIEFGKKAFGVELTIKKSDNPDTYEKLFGTAKNDLAVDAVSREAVNELVSSQKLDTFSDEGRKWANIKIDVILRGLKELPPVTPQLSSGLDKNSKKLESIATPKDDLGVDYLGVDCISRKAVQTRLKEIINEMETIFADIREREVNDSVCGLCEYDCDHGLDGFANECPGFEKDDCFKLNEKYKAEWLDISNLPSVTPQEPRWIYASEKYEHHIDHTDCIWYGNDSGCPVTCSQYRDGWNDAMDYIFKDGDGYSPYRREA